MFAAAPHAWFARPFVKEDKLAQDEKLDLDRLVADLQAVGVDAGHRPDIPALAAHLADAVPRGGVVVFMSSSGFEGIHDRLLGALRDREARRTP